MSSQLAFVWQQHSFFHTAGFAVAQALRRPIVLFVDAPNVWEARKWGVNRPGWGTIIEHFGEQPQMRSADLVACVSEEVADAVRRWGVDEKRILVTPCAVDLELFGTHAFGNRVRERLGFENKIIVGWVGSFRRFHGVELALQALAQVQARYAEVAALLVGDGLERARMERLAHELGVKNVAFTGTVPHDEVPHYMGAMDIALILDAGVQPFHYSPLKLREYMASRCAVVAPAVGQIARELSDGVDALLVPPGDSEGLAEAIRRLVGDEGLRDSLAHAARARSRENSWDRQVERTLAALNRQGLA